MALEALKNTKCVDIEAKLNAAISKLTQAKAAINAPLIELQNKLSDFTSQISSPGNLLDDALSSIEDTINGAIPEIPKVEMPVFPSDVIPEIPGAEDIQNILDKCFAIKVDFDTGSPESISFDFSIDLDFSLNFELDNIFGDFELQGLVELPITKLLDFINNILSALGITNLLAQLDGFLDCLDSLCGSDISGKMDEVNALLLDMNIDNNGVLDQNGLFSGAGLSSSKISSLTSIGDTFSNLRSVGVESASKAASSLMDTAKAIKAVAISPITMAKKISIPFC